MNGRNLHKKYTKEKFIRTTKYDVTDKSLRDNKKIRRRCIWVVVSQVQQVAIPMCFEWILECLGFEYRQKFNDTEKE